MKEQTLFEHRFWLQILGDHARFIYNALAPVELKDIAIAHSFINQYDQLLGQARMKEDYQFGSIKQASLRFNGKFTRV